MDARTTHPIGTSWKGRHSWSPWRIAWSVAIVAAFGLALVCPSVVQARTFQCRAEDVACLIASVKQANAQPGPRHEIRLATGTYTLTAVDNETDGPNGLPSVTSTLTIRGISADHTVIERAAGGPDFRLLHVALAGSLTLEGLTLRGGQLNERGGGLYHIGPVILLNSTLVGNAATLGGGLANSTTNSMATLMNSTVANNTAAISGGGFANLGTVTLSNSTVVGNAATIGGGFYSSIGTLTIANSTLVDNTASDAGGGIYSGFQGHMTFTNSTLVGNAARRGGGLFNFNQSTARLINSTVAENRASDAGGGFYWPTAGSIFLQNTLVARNVAANSGADCFYFVCGACSGRVSSLGNNLLGDPTDCDIPPLASDLMGGTPGLGPYTDNGTPGNGHFPLLGSSQAINAGNPMVCPVTDQLGQPRIGTCDIGSIEFQGTAVSSR